jgi:hypothetical protein
MRRNMVEALILQFIVLLMAPFFVGAAAGEAVAMRRTGKSGPGAAYGGMIGIAACLGATIVFLFVPLRFQLAFSFAGLPDALDILIFPCGAWACAAIGGLSGGFLVRRKESLAEEQVTSHRENLSKTPDSPDKQTETGIVADHAQFTLKRNWAK